MTLWNSNEDVSKEFGLSPKESDPSALRDALRKILSPLHPDKNGGVFTSPENEALFMRTRAALEFVDKQSQTALTLIPLTQLPAIIREISQAIAVHPPIDFSSLHASSLAEARLRNSRRFFLPRISSGAIAGVLGFLVAFPDKFEKHAFLGPLLNNSTVGKYAVPVLLGYALVFFVLTWAKEKKAEARTEYLMSEQALGPLFQLLMRLGKDAPTPDSVRLSSRQIRDAVSDLSDYRRNFTPIAIFGGGTDLPTVEKIATVQTQRLLERKVLTRVDMPSLDTWYDVNIGALGDLRRM